MRVYHGTPATRAADIALYGLQPQNGRYCHVASTAGLSWMYAQWGAAWAAVYEPHATSVLPAVQEMFNEYGTAVAAVATLEVDRGMLSADPRPRPVALPWGSAANPKLGAWRHEGAITPDRIVSWELRPVPEANDPMTQRAVRSFVSELAA